MQISPWTTSCQILLWITVQVLSVLRNINSAEHNKRKVLVQSLTKKPSKWFKPAFKCKPKVLNSHRVGNGGTSMSNSFTILYFWFI